MSWLFSRALVAEYSAATCSAGELFAPWSGSHTPQAFLPSDRMTAFSRPSRFGMTFAPLTDELGAAVLTWFREASRAKTSASPARAPALTASAAGCGHTWHGSLARLDPASRSWRTAQPSLFEDLGESSVTWPRSGMTAGGQCWELPMSAPRTDVIASGLSLPTPTAQPANGTPQMFLDRKRAAVVKGASMGIVLSDLQLYLVARERGMDGRGKVNPTYLEWMMGWPRNWTALGPLGTDKCPNAQP